MQHSISLQAAVNQRSAAQAVCHVRTCADVPAAMLPTYLPGRGSLNEFTPEFPPTGSNSTICHHHPSSPAQRDNAALTHLETARLAGCNVHEPSTQAERMQQTAAPTA